MNNFDNESYQIWHSELREVFREAIGQKSDMVIYSHLPLDLCNSADVTLYGKVLAFTSQKAQYMVDGFDLSSSRNFLPSPQCEYSFAVNMPAPGGGVRKIEYSGRAVILDRSLQKNNLPDGLLLRVSRPNRIRHLRRHARSECPAGQILMPGLVLVDKPPANRRSLLNLLANYYQRKNRQPPNIINISAGGVCLQTRDQGAQRLLSSEENYLFFFFTQKPEPGACPNIFMGKKVGIFRRDSATMPALRIRFMRELVWNDPAEEIIWKDISTEGSDTLNVLLEIWRMQGESETSQS